ncbi:MAG: DUF420 domain-containing protein [Polyangiales bacterium]
MPSNRDRWFFVANAVVSTAALAFLSWLLLRTTNTDPSSVDLSFMPHVNAAMNALSATCLLAGYFAIRKKNRSLHRTLMITAFVASTVFLIGYILYHQVHGDTRFAGEGAIRSVYFAVLISHIVLSAAVVPLALSAFYFALQSRFETHKKVARWALPIWLYVSITGVIVYAMLHA